MKKPLMTALFAVSLLFARPAAAEVLNYDLESPHTQLVFFVNHLGLSNSQGKFLKYEGHFTLDTDHPENSSAEATIYVDSLDMGNEVWSEHVKSAKLFDAEQYPTMTYKSTKVEMTGEDTARVTGDLTLLGRTRPAVLDVKLNKIGKHPMSGKDVAGLSATGTIKRGDWGMEYGLPAVSNDVELRIEVEGVRSGSASE